ncbi:angiotensin-converting enzyme-related protein-like [Convolutriloba macropyga]|uniref:angiotensin-converting enzyme-related protein-like n=1 Tax=Convolutriloba macropyga TaxID=536237 RepID=UPI003F51DBA8
MSRKKQVPVDCMVDGIPESTKRFREMMSKGRSVNWKILLKEFTGEEMNAKAVLEYFEPLEKWLNEYIKENNVPIGWPGREQ